MGHNEKACLESKITILSLRLWFDAMPREQRYLTDDYLISLQLEYKSKYGVYFPIRQYDFCINKRKIKS